MTFVSSKLLYERSASESYENMWPWYEIYFTVFKNSGLSKKETWPMIDLKILERIGVKY